MYEYIAGKEILTSNQQQIIEQILFIYSPLVKGFEKQIKTIEDQEQNQIKTLEDLKPKGQKKNQLRVNLMIKFQYKKKFIINYQTREQMRYEKLAEKLTITN